VERTKTGPTAAATAAVAAVAAVAAQPTRLPAPPKRQLQLASEGEQGVVVSDDGEIARWLPCIGSGEVCQLPYLRC
jgi:hypothetical protein